MGSEIYSAIASAISAGCALFTLYMFRSHGKGFIWTKDHKIGVLADKHGNIHLQIEIPLFNFGKGNIKFLSLKAKKINLKTKAMENFEMDMDEAYFPEGTHIISYRAPIYTEMKSEDKEGFLFKGELPQGLPDAELKEYQDKINKKMAEISEHIIILKCLYKDGSWFGKKTKETVIGLSVTGWSITYLSTSRRSELNDYFSW